MFPYVLRLAASDRRWCLAGIQIILVDRLVALVTNRSLPLLRSTPSVSLFLRGGAASRHDLLVAKSLAACVLFSDIVTKWFPSIVSSSARLEDGSLLPSADHVLFSSIVTRRGTPHRVGASLLVLLGGRQRSVTRAYWFILPIRQCCKQSRQ